MMYKEKIVLKTLGIKHLHIQGLIKKGWRITSVTPHDKTHDRYLFEKPAKDIWV